MHLGYAKNDLSEHTAQWDEHILLAIYRIPVLTSTNMGANYYVPITVMHIEMQDKLNQYFVHQLHLGECTIFQTVKIDGTDS